MTKSADGYFNMMPNPHLILASSSPYRQRLLEQLLLKFTVCPANIDERQLEQQYRVQPKELAMQLAIAKARNVCLRYPAAIIIGSDQVCCLDNTVLHKPGSRENNILQLELLAEKSHQLITAVAVIDPRGDTEMRLLQNITRLKMRPLSRSEIERYVDHDQAWDCAGGYKIESLGISLFEKIETEDHTAIQGLPLLGLATLLRESGINIP